MAAPTALTQIVTTREGVFDQPGAHDSFLLATRARKPCNLSARVDCSPKVDDELFCPNIGRSPTHEARPGSSESEGRFKSL